MNEEVFKELLGEMIRSEFSVFDDAEWDFSLKHRLAMKRIFARFQKNTRRRNEEKPAVFFAASADKPKLSLRQRFKIAMLFVLMVFFLAGCGLTAVFISQKFRGAVYRDRTVVRATDIDNSPEYIEYGYRPSVPEGFEVVEKNISVSHIYTKYENESTGQTISYYQWVKSHFAPNVDTERFTIETIDINGSEGLYVDGSDEEITCSYLVWDKGDYIIEIFAFLDKESILKLLNLTKFEISQ